MVRRILRGIITIVGGICGYGVYQLIVYIAGLNGYDVEKSLSTPETIFAILVLVFIFGLIFYRLFPLFTKGGRKAATNLESDLQSTSVNDLISTTAGLIIGLIVAFLINRGVFSSIEIPVVNIVLNILSFVIFGALGIFIANSKAKEITSLWLSSRRITSVGGKGAKKTDATPKIFDTSVIIDGRISDIMKTGFIEGPIVIPEFVLVELRHIADSSDSLKRNRGRRGLDVLNKIQSDYGIEIYNTEEEKSLEEIPEVDVKLLKLAQIMNGQVVTNDFNLNKVAAIKGVPVLNINELANALKPVVLPGEEMILTLVKEGKERNQAVAYLDDGTMIVVEEGRKFIGQTRKVIVASVLQTSAGRMIFAKPAGNV